MGAFNLIFPQELQGQLSRLQNLDEIAPKMLNRAAPIVVEAIVDYAPKDTKELAKSVKALRAKKQRHGRRKSEQTEAWELQITFEGEDERRQPSPNHPGRGAQPIKNIVKAAYIEYGTSFRPARPFIRPALDSVVDKVAAAFQSVIAEEGVSR